MIVVDIAETHTGGAWEDVVAGCGGNPIHLPAVHLPAAPARRLRYLVARSGTEVVACALGVAAGSRWDRLRGRDTELTLPTPPAVRGDRDPVMEAVLAAARERGFRKVVVGTAAGDSFLDAPRLARFVSSRILEFVLDLRRDRETIHAAMHKVHRKNIRRAERAGITVAPEPTRDALLALRSMQEVAAERSRQKGGGFRVLPVEYFDKLYEHVFSTGIGELWVARRGGDPVAALAFLGTAQTAMTVRSGSTEEGYETRAMYPLQAAVIDRALERGFARLSLGGVPEAAAEEGHPEHGLHDFKKGFGAAPCLRTGLDVDL
jgi:hypothetical protein